MEVSLKQPADVSQDSKQKTTGAIFIGTGVLLLVIGIIVIGTLPRGPNANIWLRNLSPMVAFVGIIMIAQGILILRLKGRRLTAWYMTLPSVIFILAIGVVPLVYSFGLSFIQWDIKIPTRSFIFLDNYIDALTSARVWAAMGRSFLVAVSAVVLQFVLGIGLALLLTGRFPGKGIVVAIVITPLMMAPVVVGQAWRMLWDTQFGAVNHVLSIITGQEVLLQWLADPQLAIFALIITDVWHHTPFVFLISLAALLAIDLELYEAASIDGGSRWQMFWQISLPIIRPVLLVILLFRLIDALKLVDHVYILTNGGPGYSTETYALYLYQQGFQFGRFGFTAAASYIFLVIVAIIDTVLIRRIGER